MTLANKKMRERICHLLAEAKNNEHTPAEFIAAADNWVANMNDAEGSKKAAAELKPLIAAGCREGLPGLQGASDARPLPREAFTVDHWW